MTYRWAVMVTLAMLSSSVSPATAWGQSPRAPRGAKATSDSDGAAEPDDPSPAVRFAAAAAQPLRDRPARPTKRSVLEPSTSHWLEDDGSGPGDGGPSPNDLAPADLLGPAPIDLPPEPMPDAMTLVPGDPSPTLGPGDFISPSPESFFDRMPRLPPNRQPMLRESWMFRPFNISIFEGALFATPPITPQFNTSVAFFTGFRVGWDFSTHFGGETRFGTSKVFLLDVARTTEVGYQRLFYFDSNLLIYPWGDTRWRPFLSLGGGLADVFIAGNNGLRLHPGAFNFPFGGGIKYRLGSRVAFRADVRDNLTFSGSGGLRTLNNIEVVGGIEFHFGGGDRRSYWPWNPSRHWW